MTVEFIILLLKAGYAAQQVVLKVQASFQHVVLCMSNVMLMRTTAHVIEWYECSQCQLPQSWFIV